jgi:hypothetical protein
MPQDKAEIRIGGERRDFISIRPLWRCHPEQDDYWDGNWVESEIRVRVGGFQGSFRASLRSDEFQKFKRELTRLSTTLAGKATFATMEEQLTITMDGNGRGHIQVSGQATDMAGIGNRLNFSLEIDQTHLPAIIAALSSILQKFPVVGTSDA